MINKIKRIWTLLLFLFLTLTACLPLSYAANNGVSRYGLSASDAGIDMASGNKNGINIVHKFGENPDIDTASGFETVWGGGGTYTGFNATSAEIVDVFSASANDNGSGTGARTIQLYGLDSDYAEVDETVTLNGTSATKTSNNYIRLDRAIVRSAGSSGWNEGVITVRQGTTTANIFCKIQANYNQTTIGAYTVPASKTAYLLGWYSSLSIKQTGYSTLKLEVRPFGEVFQVKEVNAVISDGDSHFDRVYRIPKNGITEKSDIQILANSSVNNLGVAAGFDLVVVDN